MKKFLTSVTAAVLALGMCLATACNPTSNGLSLEIADGNWKNFAGEAAEVPPYTITYKDGLLELGYKKTDTWQYVNRVFSEEEADLAKVNTIKLEAKIETPTAEPKCLLKLFYVGEGVQYKGNQYTELETAQFTLSKTDYAVYEWDVREMHLEKAMRMDIYVECGTSNVEGKMSIKSLKLTDSVVADKDAAINNWERYEPKPPVPDDPNAPKVNTISQATPAVANWYGDDNYTIVKNNDNTYDVTKKANSTWTALKADVEGDLAYAKQFKMVVSGINGKDMIVKPFDNDAFQVVEEPAAQDEVTFVCDLTATPTKTVEYDKKNNILVFFEFDENAPEATFKIKSAEFVYDVNNVSVNAPAVTKWSGGTAFTVAAGENGAVNVTKAANTGWASLKAYLSGEYTYAKQFNMVISGVQGKDIIVKPYDNNDFEFKKEPSTTDELNVSIDLTKGKNVDYSKPLIILFEFDNGAPEATFTIKSAEFVFDVNEITTENTAVTKWSGGDVFTVAAGENGAVNVTKAANGGWAQLKAYVTGADLANMKTFTITFKGVEGLHVIAKPYDKVEEKGDPSKTDELTLTVDLTKATNVTFENNVLSVLIFFEWDAKTETTFTIVSASFSTTPVATTPAA